MFDVAAHPVPRPRSWFTTREGVSCALSGLVHAAVWGATVAGVLWWGDRTLETTRFAGRQRVVHLQSQWAPDSPPPAVEVESAVQVVIEPTAARIENHHFRPATDVELVLQDVGEPAVTQRTEPAPETPPEPNSARPIPKAASSAAPSIAKAAAVPQTLGTEATTPPKFFANRPPVYPEAARMRGWHGTVLLNLSIDAEGRVTAVTLRESSGHAILDAEAIAAVKLWRAEPARRGGQAVATEEILPVRFVLR